MGLLSLIIALATPAVGFETTGDVAYAQGPRGRLDVYSPRGPHAGAPVVVFVYGGGWEGGKRSLYRFVGASLARHGMVAVIPDYRLYPKVRYPAFLEDNARAVAWARGNAGRFGGDPGKLFLMGHSAGAYNVAMLALDRRWLGAVGVDPRRDVRGVIGLSGPYDFLPLQSATLKAIFGPEDARPETQPINHVDGQAPPFFLAHGAGDRTVLPRNTVNLAARIEARGGQVETVYYPGKGHPATVKAFLPLLNGGLDIPARVFAFIRAHSDSADARAAA